MPRSRASALGRSPRSRSSSRWSAASGRSRAVGGSSSRAWRVCPAGLALLPAAALLTGDARFLFLVPAGVYLWLALMAAQSLREEISLIERFARILQPRAPEFIRPYCRKVTTLWAFAFLVAAVVIVYLVAIGAVAERRAFTAYGLWAPMGVLSAHRVRSAESVVPLLRGRRARRGLGRAPPRREHRAGAALARVHPRCARAHARRRLHAARGGGAAVSAKGGGRRVVVTGMGGICALGGDWAAVGEGLRNGRSGVAIVPELAGIAGLKTQLGAPVAFERPAAWPRKAVRSMGRVAQLAARATEHALAQAGLAGSPLLRDGTTGVAYGSTSGSPPDMVSYARAFGVDRSAKGVTPTEYLRLMSHTCAASLASFFGVRGRIVPTPSACTSGSQAIGYGYEAIRFGRAERMLCGGADEFHPIQAAVFDLLFASSTRNDAPDQTPRPFDADRDGLVVGEGAATLVLEEREARARARRDRPRRDRGLRHQLRRRSPHRAGRRGHGGGHAPGPRRRGPRAVRHRLRERARDRDGAGRRRRERGDAPRASARACR